MVIIIENESETQNRPVEAAIQANCGVRYAESELRSPRIQFGAIAKAIPTTRYVNELTIKNVFRCFSSRVRLLMRRSNG